MTHRGQADEHHREPSERVPSYYIAATVPVIERRPRTLKHGHTFALFDHYGDIVPDHANPEGLFCNDTRHLSRLELKINGIRPLLLSSIVDKDDALLTVDLANPDYYLDDQLILRRDVIHIRRSKFLWNGACYERLAAQNFGDGAQDIVLELAFDGDFRDIFEVRGERRARRGRTKRGSTPTDDVLLQYEAVDGRLEETAIRFDPAPNDLTSSAATFRRTLKANGRDTIFVEVRCSRKGDPETPRRCFYVNYRKDRRARHAARTKSAIIESSDNLFDEVLGRALSDMYMLTTETDHGPYPFAGIPWFTTAFGRDGIITALQCQWLDPAISRGVLQYLAATQATEENFESEAEPGKILHETRAGEMARLGEVPFGQYYGSVDATPLFVVLAGEYLRRSGDTKTVRALWPNIESALEWINTYGDIDGDGFVEYLPHNERGLVNQGWKDSDDSIFHADGTLASGPICLAEVQGYVYAAKRLASQIALSLGKAKVSATLETEAQDLQDHFQDAFWCEDLSTYVLALDGDKKQCAVRTSNAGHALFSGIASPEHARQVADTLLSRDCYSGWGVRTVATSAARYNPMSYHNGSIWPHDNALIAHGLARYGLKRHALKIFQGIFEAATYIDLRRLPELFCGFNRRRNSGPTFYPTACSPQAWASASIFGLLQACLGLSFDHEAREIKFHKPALLGFIEELRLRNLELGTEKADVILRNHGDGLSVDVLRRTGDLKVVVVH